MGNLEPTDIDAHKDEMVRRILSLERSRTFPLDVDDESQLLDILKVIADRIIQIEERLAKLES